MLIGIEASRANRLRKTGVEWYAYHLIQKMKALVEAKKHSWLLYSNTPLAMGLEKGLVNWHERRLSWPPKYLWTQVRLTGEMMRRKPDVLFVPAHVLPRVIPKKTVVTIHDVGFHRFPQLYKKRQVYYHEWSTKDIVKRAARILTVSVFSKQELVDFYHVDPDRVFVTHLAIDHERYQPMTQTEANPLLARFELGEKFLFFVGRVERKKNVLTLVEAFHQYKEKRNDDLELAIAGIPGEGFDEIERLAMSGAGSEQIKFLGYITEQEKAALLSRATAMVHPAWYEGFGITPLEAMACGCPVICSSSSCLPEVEGIENALWFQPGDIDTLVMNIDHVVRSKHVREELRARGLVHAKKYTWEHTAEQTMRYLTEW